MESASISICNQKGGVGKSTFTVLLASYLHYIVGHDVLVVDCDYQSSDMRAVGSCPLGSVRTAESHLFRR
nr:ParA family protein [Alistipes finegoldii]